MAASRVDLASLLIAGCYGDTLRSVATATHAFFPLLSLSLSLSLFNPLFFYISNDNCSFYFSIRIDIFISAMSIFVLVSNTPFPTSFPFITAAFDPVIFCFAIPFFFFSFFLLWFFFCFAFCKHGFQKWPEKKHTHLNWNKNKSP